MQLWIRQIWWLAYLLIPQLASEFVALATCSTCSSADTSLTLQFKWTAAGSHCGQEAEGPPEKRCQKIKWSIYLELLSKKLYSSFSFTTIMTTAAPLAASLTTRSVSCPKTLGHMDQGDGGSNGTPSPPLSHSILHSRNRAELFTPLMLTSVNNAANSETSPVVSSEQ